MDNLAKIEKEITQSISEMTSSMPTMTPDKVAKISERMVEMDRANQTLGRKNTQTTNQLMTLTMLTDSPYRRLRQCLTQIEQKRKAVESYYWEWRKQKIEMEDLRNSDDPLSILQVEQYEYQSQRGAIYIEGALKEIAIFQEAYEEIRKANNIPETWDEEDAELDEIRHHLRQAFRQAHRDMTLTGSITQGNAEYLEQYGVHLQTARSVIGTYISACQKMIEEGRPPNITHLYDFLDYCVDGFGEEFHHVLDHIGLSGIIRQEYLYKSTK